MQIHVGLLVKYLGRRGEIKKNPLDFSWVISRKGYIPIQIKKEKAQKKIEVLT